MEVRLPEAVQRMAEEADRVQAEIAAAMNPPTDPPLEQPAPAEPVAATPEPVAPVVPEQQAELEQLRQQYATLRGKYNTELPRAYAHIEELNERIKALEAAAAPKTPPAPAATDQDKEAFGADLMDAVERIAAAKTAAFAEQLAARDAEIAELRAQVSTVDGKVSSNTFFGQLDSLLPDWETTNTDQAFLAWLDEVDPLTGLARKSILDRHVAAQDVARTIGIFKLFRQLNAAPQPQPPAPPNPLEVHVAPNRSGAGNAPAPTQATVWTQRSIAKFYDDVRRGVHTPDQAAKMEADLMAAVAAGQVGP